MTRKRNRLETMKKIIGNLVIFLAAVFLALLFGESAVRLLYRTIANYNMEMWRYASDLKQPMANPRLPFHHFPDKEGDYYGVHIKTNSMGFRYREITFAKPEGTKRILLLGDSFTLGWGVPFEETYSSLLEKYLNQKEKRTEVVNLGVGNYNSIMELELFKLKGLELNPDLVILMYYINDAEPTPIVTTSFKYSLVKHSYLVAFLFDRYIKLKPLLNKSYGWNEYYSNLYKEGLPGLSANREAIKELIRVCKGRDVQLLIVNIPELRVLKEYPFPSATEFVRGIAREGNVVFFDLLPSLAREEPSTLWVSTEDPHANSKANAIIAEALFKKLMSEPSLLKK
jgi:lysophospholipase L1-like esterase